MLAMNQNISNVNLCCMLYLSLHISTINLLLGKKREGGWEDGWIELKRRENVRHKFPKAKTEAVFRCDHSSDMTDYS